MSKFDCVIAGAGIIGLALARELKARRPQAKILVLEKEDGLGKHASGRNSGVLHSGIFYSEDSLKAEVCARGALEMASYCLEKRLPLRTVGKIILPVNPGDEERLELLYDRGKRNRIRAEILSAGKLAAIEPGAAPRRGKALHLPDVKMVEPLTILERLAFELRNAGVEIRFHCPFERVDPGEKSLTAGGEIFSYGHFFNAAGLQADRVAKAFGAGKEYMILPVKGLYYKVAPESGLQIQSLIYAVPDPRIPFLGIHFSRTIAGELYAGPTVVPSFGRENYRGVSGVYPAEAAKILWELIGLYCSNKQGFRTFAHREALRFMKRRFYEAARKLVPRLKIEHLLPSDKVGIRAQLVNASRGELVMDFLVENEESSTHVLNAVSPAFTSSFAFAKLVLDKAAIT